LVVEILSPVTRSRDMADKLNTYMLSGVKEYWIIDPQKQTVLIYGFKDYHIDVFTTYKVTDIITSYWFEKLETSIKDIFG
jgi:Uma2 family endonuclease